MSLHLLLHGALFESCTDGSPQRINHAVKQRSKRKLALGDTANFPSIM